MKRMILSLVFGAVSGAILWGASSVLHAGGHGTGLAFTLSFPYCEVIHRLHPGASNSWLIYGIAILQMPVYALTIAGFRARRHRLIGLAIPFAIHAVGIGLAILPQSSYETFW